MNVTQADIGELRELWKRAAQEQESYFDRIYKVLVGEAGSEEQLERYRIAVKPEFMQDADKGVVEWLNKEIPKIVVRLIELSKASSVISDVDRGDLKFLLRELLASLRLHQYQHWGTHIHSESAFPMRNGLLFEAFELSSIPLPLFVSEVFGGCRAPFT
jgi:hypothetical protein